VNSVGRCLQAPAHRPQGRDLLVLSNNDPGGVEDVVTGTVSGLVSTAPITAAPRPGARRFETDRCRRRIEMA
jgi:hypothetical protein